MKVIGVYNLKGGTGKTTISVHLASILAESGYSTVLVGMDRQGDAVRWLAGGEANISNGTVLNVRPGLVAIFSGEEYPAALRRAEAAVMSAIIADLPPQNGVASGVPADLWIVPVDGRLALEDLMSVVDELNDTGGKVLVVFNRADAGGKRILGQLQRAAAKIANVTVWPEIIPDSAPIKRAGDLLRLVQDVPFGEDSDGRKALNALAQTVIRTAGLKKVALPPPAPAVAARGRASRSR